MHTTKYPAHPEGATPYTQQLRDLFHALRLVLALVARPYATAGGAA